MAKTTNTKKPAPKKRTEKINTEKNVKQGKNTKKTNKASTSSSSSSKEKSLHANIAKKWNSGLDPSKVLEQLQIEKIHQSYQNVLKQSVTELRANFHILQLILLSLNAVMNEYCHDTGFRKTTVKKELLLPYIGRFFSYMNAYAYYIGAKNKVANEMGLTMRIFFNVMRDVVYNYNCDYDRWQMAIGVKNITKLIQKSAPQMDKTFAMMQQMIPLCFTKPSMGAANQFATMNGKNKQDIEDIMKMEIPIPEIHNLIIRAGLDICTNMTGISVEEFKRSLRDVVPGMKTNVKKSENKSKNTNSGVVERLREFFRNIFVGR